MEGCDEPVQAAALLEADHRERRVDVGIARDQDVRLAEVHEDVAVGVDAGHVEELHRLAVEIQVAPADIEGIGRPRGGRINPCRPGDAHALNVRLHNMKTIAISIDDDTLERVDRLTTKTPGAKNRSQVIRQAVREYVQRAEQTAEDEREARIVRQHRGRLSRQARTLVREQAKP